MAPYARRGHPCCRKRQQRLAADAYFCVYGSTRQQEKQATLCFLRHTLSRTAQTRLPSARNPPPPPATSSFFCFAVYSFQGMICFSGLPGSFPRLCCDNDLVEQLVMLEYRAGARRWPLMAPRPCNARLQRRGLRRKFERRECWNSDVGQDCPG